MTITWDNGLLPFPAILAAQASNRRQADDHGAPRSHCLPVRRRSQPEPGEGHSPLSAGARGMFFDPAALRIGAASSLTAAPFEAVAEAQRSACDTINNRLATAKGSTMTRPLTTGSGAALRLAGC